MSRITGRRSAYGHSIRNSWMAGYYIISWTYDTKIKGSRLRWPRTMSRETDEAGALKFSKKWDTPMPEKKNANV